MISDTLFDAVVNIDEYLNEPATSGCYTGELRNKIIRLRNEMDALRAEIDYRNSVDVKHT